MGSDQLDISYAYSNGTEPVCCDKTHKLHEVVPQKSKDERDQIRLVVVVDSIQEEQLVVRHAEARAECGA